VNAIIRALVAGRDEWTREQIVALSLLYGMWRETRELAAV